MPPADALMDAALLMLATRPRVVPDFVSFLASSRIRSDDPLNPGVADWQPWQHLVERAEAWERGASEVILKDRQLGFTWLLAAYLCWRARYSGWQCGVWSKGQIEARKLLDRVEFIDTWSGGGGKHTADESEWPNGGLVHAFASTESAGVSFTFQVAAMDELAFHPWGGENYTALQPTLSAGGQFIAFSTANPLLGGSGVFHDLYWASKRHETPYTALFVPWHARPGRDQVWLARQRAAYKGFPDEFDAYYAETDTAAFTGKSGVVYPMFSEERHVKAKPCEWRDCKRRVVGIDWGGRGEGNPMAIIPLGLTGLDRIHQFGEYYEQRVDDPLSAAVEYINLLRHRGGVDLVVYDPSEDSMGRTLAAVLAQDNIPCGPANNDRGRGLGLVAYLLANDLLTIGKGCTESIAEFPLYRVQRKRDPNDRTTYATSSPVDHHGDACLIAGTPVMTERGEVPIETVMTQDRVLTRAGWAPVTWSGMTSPGAEVLRVRMSDGRGLVGTASHPVWIEGAGFTRIDALRYGDRIAVCNHSTATITANMAAGDTGTRRVGETAARCIRTCGGSITDRSLRDSLFITSTITPTTMTSPISPLWRSPTMPRITRRDTIVRRGMPSLAPLNGTAPLRGGLGIQSMESVPMQGEQRLNISASNAARSSDLAPEATFASVDETVRRAPYVLAVEPQAKSQPVYNLTVQGQAEFYANGILVHNCDARRYAAMALLEGTALMVASVPELVLQ